MEQDPLIVKDDKQPRPEQTHVRNLVFVNAVLVLIAVTVSLTMPVFTQYLYQRISQDVFNNTNLNISRKACYVNETDRNYILQEEAQEMASAKQMQFSIFRSCISFFTVMFAGAYSDFIGRKCLFLLSLGGMFVRNVVVSIVIFWKLDINLFFLSEGIDGLGGSYYAILLALYAVIADNTPPTGARTIGIIFVDFSFALGSALTSIASGFFIQNVGFFYPSLTATLLNLLILIIVVLFLPKSPYIETQDGPTRCVPPLKAITRVLGFYVLEGTRVQKACFIVVLTCFVFSVMDSVGSSNIGTLFELNQPFCWNPEKIGFYNTAMAIVYPVIGIPVTRLMQHFCPDELIVLIQSLIAIVANVLHALAATDAMLYIVIGVGSLSGMIVGVVRSILSRMVPHNKQGSMFASVAAVETVTSLVGVVSFSKVYQATVSFWRGFVYIIMAGTHGIAAVFIVVFICLVRYERRQLLQEGLIQQEE